MLISLMGFINRLVDVHQALPFHLTPPPKKNPNRSKTKTATTKNQYPVGKRTFVHVLGTYLPPTGGKGTAEE